MKKIISGLCLCLLTSCGAKKESTPLFPAPTEELETTQGSFKAILRPYNFNLAGWIPSGMADIKIDGDQIEIKSWLDDAANVMHRQNIHLGSRCPTIEDDINHDGFVDLKESKEVAKEVFLPLDQDLDSLSLDENNYPIGNFSYHATASVRSLSQKLNQNLKLSGKVIIVTGVASNRGLPASVSQENNQTRESSIPIACGLIERMPY
jgi:hypothetical protein